VVAVSGGCDSMTLLDVLAHQAGRRGYDLVAAHYDHGLRPESAADRQLVEAAAHRYGLSCVVGEGALRRASEAEARRARWNFLEQVRRDQKAAGVITAHHQDDLIETSLLNLARGTGRRGLAPMQAGPVRPLLGVGRSEIIAYARTQDVLWREDSTNEDRSNPRNFLRHELLPLAHDAWSQRYSYLIDQVGTLNQEIDDTIEKMGVKCEKFAKKADLPRNLILNLSLDEIAEVMYYLVNRMAPGFELERRLLQELALFAKTGRPGRRRPLRGGLELLIEHKQVIIVASKASQDLPGRVYWTGISEEGRSI
jgi:tRNA(Ile)-lysidine synthase